jgi:putative membrane protein
MEWPMGPGTALQNDMMDGGMWGWPYTWSWMAGLWLVLVVVAALVYLDAQKRGMNGLLWAALVLIPLLGFVALVLYILARETGKPQQSPGRTAAALLDERYVRGELSRDEYLRMKGDLNQAPK